MLFPALVNVRENAGKLRYAFLALSIQAMIAVPAAAGLALVAREVPSRSSLVPNGWARFRSCRRYPLVYGVAAVSHAAGYLLLTLGKVRLLAIVIWMQLIFFSSEQ